MLRRRNGGREGLPDSSGRPEKGSDYYGVAAAEASIPVESERSQCKLIKAGGAELPGQPASQSADACSCV